MNVWLRCLALPLALLAGLSRCAPLLPTAPPATRAATRPAPSVAVGATLIAAPTVTPTLPAASHPPSMSPTPPARWQEGALPTAAVAFHYPPEWLLINQGEGALTLVPRAEQDWEAASPADLPRDPAIHLLVGEQIRERAGPGNFPATISPETLRAWLEARVALGEASLLNEHLIGGSSAFQLVESGESGCEMVAYWRPLALDQLVRLATGCHSAYLDDFQRLIATLHTSDG